MPINASSGGASARLEIRRPSWADMSKHYPASAISTPTLYDSMIGGRFKELYKNAAYENTCAVRMSYALNRSGLKLGNAPSSGGSIQGGDGYLYWIRVSDLKPHLGTQFKGADEKLDLPLIPAALIADRTAMGEKFKERVKLAREWMDASLQGRRGIVVFDVTGWGDASGHFTLWDGVSKTLAYASPHDDPSNNLYYFWLTELRQKKDGTDFLIQLSSVKFWELK